MNKNIKKIISISLAVMAITAFAGCDKDETSSQIETTVATTAVATTANNSLSDITTDLNALHSYDTENGDELAGAWQITGGTGDQFESFVYIFDGNGRATLALSNMGYSADYTLDESNKTLEVQLVFGLNGNYNYKFAEDNNTVTLTNTSDNSTTIIEKLGDFSMIPMPDKNPQIDESILGAWLSDDGEYLYFDADGIMYQNLYGMTMIYSNYSAVDGVITSEYTMQNEHLTDTYKYSVTNNVLTLNDTPYNKIPASELN